MSTNQLLQNNIVGIVMIKFKFNQSILKYII